MSNTLTWRLALRYLRGKRSANVVPVLSRISMVAITISSAAMVIIISVFNGLDSTVKDMYQVFYPDIKISAAKGKFFRTDTARFRQVNHIAGVRAVTPVIEDNVFAVSNDQQKVITLKGIADNYSSVNPLAENITDGDSVVTEGVSPTDTSAGVPASAIVGRNIINELGSDVNAMSYIVLNYPNPDITNPIANPTDAIQSLTLHPAGVFQVSDEFDSKFVFAPLPLVQQLFSQQGKLSSIEIAVEPGAEKAVGEKLRQMFGRGFKVESRYEQNKTLYSVMGIEKLVVYVILALVLFIASFNMVGALSMLVLEKQKDIAILIAMGAQQETVRTIFLLEGMLWSLVGGLIGISLGIGICLLQEQLHLIKMGKSFALNAFPVEIQVLDLLIILCIVLTVGLLTSWFPAARATQAVDPSLKSA